MGFYVIDEPDIEAHKVKALYRKPAASGQPLP
jgi:hypothetical protein